MSTTIITTAPTPFGPSTSIFASNATQLPVSAQMSPVEFIRPELQEKLLIYERIRAALAGEDAIKALGEKVLPRPNAHEVSPANLARYDMYLRRAVWYNVSGRTLAGLTGYVFAKEPVVKLPPTLASIETNVDGAGVTLNQQAKESLRCLLAFGRAGLLVDYPKSEKTATLKDLVDGNMAPTIVLYEPEQITNWRTSHIGAKQVLDMLVLHERQQVPSDDNEFEVCERDQYRVLNRTPDGVTGRIFRKDKQKNTFAEVPDEAYDPKDKTGKSLLEIPFVFLGSVNNDAPVDTPPLLDLVNLNIAHFRNSADHEEACYIVGQPTPWVSGLSEGWVTNVLKNELQLGSRAVIPLPQGGAAGLLQANPNTLPSEAMKHKEEQMVKLGAKLVEQDGTQKTATEVHLAHAADVSVLTSAATNMFLAYKQALEFCGLFVGSDTASVEFDLTEPLTREVLDPAQATSLLGLWQGGLINFEEARWSLKKSGVAYLDDDVVQEAVANEGLPPNPNAPPPAPGDPNNPPPKDPKAPPVPPAPAK